MKNIGGTSKYIAFIDECGDHSLRKIDPDFPLFLLAMLVVEREHYADAIMPQVNKLKLKYWNHEGVNLHSRDIRKSKGPFSFMMNPVKRTSFLDELSQIMNGCRYTLFISAIDKTSHKEQYGANAHNPYHLALKFNLERVYHFMELQGETEIPIIAEARGKSEDEAMEIEFLRLMTSGTEFMKDGFNQLNWPLVFKNKRDNIIGIQLADLCAHPCARHILKPTQANQAYEIAKRHIYENGEVKGWRVFP